MKFPCYLCQSSFSNTSGLRKHQRNVHNVPMVLRRRPNTANDFRCVVCQLTFYRKSNLKRHILNIHCMNSNELSTSLNNSTVSKPTSKLVNSLPVEVSQEDELPFSLDIFECAHCGDTFCRKNSLVRHMKMRHLSSISDCKLLEDILPEWPGTINVSVLYVVNEERRQFFSKFSISMKNVTEFNLWMSKFQNKNKITWRKRSVHPCLKPNLLYQVKFACHHHTKPQLGSASPKHTKCPANMQCKIFSSVNEVNNYAEIRINHVHNHEFDSKDILKFREPINEVKNKFRAMFSTGLTPAEALKKHKEDLEYQYAAEFSNIAADRGICPNRAWAYHFKTVPQKTESSETTDHIRSSPSEKSFVSQDSSKLYNVLQMFSDAKNKSNTAEDGDNISLVRNNVILNVKTSTLQELTGLIRLSDQSNELKVHQSLIKKEPCIETSTQIVRQNDDNEDHDLKIVPSINNSEMETNDDVFEEFDEMNSTIKKMVCQNPKLVEGLAQMVRNFHQHLNNTEALNIALRNFGLPCG